eukprot:7539939-Ditylum_brightwellii.AAC.1
MAGEEEYKDKLRRHNAYINSVTAVEIFGLSKDDMYTNMVIEEEHMFLEEYKTDKFCTLKQWKKRRKQIPREGDKLEGFKYPVRAKSSRNKTIGSYVDALVKKYPPVQAYLQKTYN